MKKLIPIFLTLLVFFGGEKLFSQISIKDENYSLSIPADSIFIQYVPPKIPEEYKTGSEEDDDLFVTIFVQVDTNGKAQ